MSGKREKVPDPTDARPDGLGRRRRGRERSSSPPNANVSFTSTTSQETEPESMVAAASFLEPQAGRRQSALDMHTILNPTPSLPAPSLSRRRSAAHLEDAEEAPSPKRPQYNTAQNRAATLPRSSQTQYFEASKNPFPDDRKVSTSGATLSPLRSPTRGPTGAFAPFPAGPGGPEPPRRRPISESPTATPFRHPVATLPPLSRPPSSTVSSLNASPVSSASTHIPPPPSLTHALPYPPPHADLLGLPTDPYGAMAGYGPPGGSLHVYPPAPGATYGGVVLADGTPLIELHVDNSGAGSKEMNKRREKNADASKRFRSRMKVHSINMKQENQELKHELQQLRERLERRDADIEAFREMVPDRSRWPRQPGDTPEPQPAPPFEEPPPPAPPRRRRMPTRRTGRSSTAPTTPVSESRQLMGSEGYFSGAGTLPQIDRSRQSSVSEGARTPILGPQGDSRSAGSGGFGVDRDSRGFGFSSLDSRPPIGGNPGRMGPGASVRSPLGTELYPPGTRAEQRLGSLFEPRPPLGISVGLSGGIGGGLSEGLPAPGGGVMLPFGQHGLSRAPETGTTRSEAPVMDSARPVLPPLGAMHQHQHHPHHPHPPPPPPPPPSSGPPYPPHSAPGRPL